MISKLCVTFFFALVSSQQPPPGVVEDLLNIFYNGIVAFQDCSSTQVLLPNINFALYTKENPQQGILLDTRNFNAVNPQNRTIFIIHGWLGNGTQALFTAIKDAYLNVTSANVIIVDWSFYAVAKYGAAFCSVPQVGELTGDLIYNLTLAGRINLNDTQINGFSLGGQIAGYAGQQVQNRTGGRKIGRINGLDSAGPGFLGLPLNERIDASDALFVQGIHTSNWQYGYTPVYATVDFQLNFKVVPGCGAIQPGCPINPAVPPSNVTDFNTLLNYVFCNHVRSVVYFIESISSSNYIGVPCSNCKMFGIGACKSQPTILMGENCPSTARGVIYLNTNDRVPFGRGLRGV